jgi:putative ABC transport system permease protein
MRRFLHRLLTLVRHRRAEDDLSREVDAHLRLLEDSFVAGGMSADDARYAARRTFGGVEQAKEHHRDARTFRGLAGWPMDLRLGARMLAKSPGLTVVAVIALSVAIGAGVTYLEVVNELYRPTFPGKDGDRIVGLVNWNIEKDAPETRALHDFLAWRASLTSIEDVGASVRFERNLVTEDGRAEPAKGVEISAAAFRIIPTPPLLGRPLIAEDERPSAPPVAVIGHPLWQARFGGDAAIVGRTIRLGNVVHTIVGVMPPEFGFPLNHSLWVPLKVTTTTVKRGEGPVMRVFGRLRPDVDLQTAQAEMTALSLRRTVAVDSQSPQLRPQVKPYLQSRFSDDPDDRMQMIVLYTLNVFFIGLLAVCGANVATLVFARTATRESEISVRTALGASRGRIVAQLFAEALVLVSVATTVGLIAAKVGIREFANYVGSQGFQMPFWWNDDFSPVTLAYAMALTMFAAAIVGVVPALKATGKNMQAQMKLAAGATAGLRFGRLWTGVIVMQVAFTVFFLLTVTSLAWNAREGQSKVKYRFNPTEHLAARLEMDHEGPYDEEFRKRFAATYFDVERRLEEHPNVRSVTYSGGAPGKAISQFWVEMDGVEPISRPTDGPLWVRSPGIAHDFFDALGVPIVRGRAFTPVEALEERPVAIVDETFVKLILGGRDPIGLRIRHRPLDESKAGPWLQIVGVAQDFAQKEGKTTEDAYLFQPVAPGGRFAIQMLVRMNGDAQPWSQTVRTAAAAVSPAVRVYDLQTFDDIYREDEKVNRMLAQGLSVVAAVGLLLSTAGIYSLMSFTLARRTREIGIRTALGAAPRRIVTALFSRAFVQIGLGIIVGSIPGGALVAFGGIFETADGSGVNVALGAIAVVSTLVLLVAAVACAIPSRRALRIHPTDALRAE